ncbi:MAG: undecaprenyl-phosphate glucose phosphotransferase [Clostridia bacterium]|nr:undecaprenyl-phosphate glucose phosphotransferase [Deltaproteobacteria bacterium]
MLRRHHRFFQSIQVLRDAVLVAFAVYLAHLVRFSFPQTFPFREISPLNETMWVGAALTVGWPVIGWASGLYVSRRTRSAITEVFDCFKVSLISFLVIVTFTYFVRDVRFSRGVFVLWALASFIVVALARVLSRIALGILRARGFNLRHVLVVGTGHLARRVVSTVEQNQSLGLRVTGIIALDEEKERIGEELDGVRISGVISNLRSILNDGSVDQVLVALPMEQLGALKTIMATLSQETVDVRVIPDLYQYMTLCGGIDEFAGLPLINLQATPLVGWNLVIKRFFDVLMACAGLLVVSPIMAALALIVRFSSRGAIFYAQERVGMDGRTFTMYKFRTMCASAEADGEKMTTAKDPRRTTIGIILRTLSLDELPQLWNVLRGDMSIVGPRPEQPGFVEDFKREIPRYALRHKIKAGMTGWAQVNGMRGNTSIEKRIELDLYYIENWSMGLDMKILARTVFGGFLSRNAY